MVRPPAEDILGDFKLLYTIDHGDMAQSHSLYAKGPAAYEEITNVPFILRGFGKGEVDTPVSHIDVVPTVWDFFGFKKPMMMQGESLLPIIAGDRPWNKRAMKPSWDYTGCTRQRAEPDYEPPQHDYNTGLVPDTLVRVKT